MRGRRLYVVVPIAIVLVVLLTWRIARAKHQQHMADLAACLLGDPLEPGELASVRMDRVDLAAPWPRMVRSSGDRGYVPEKSAREEWPDRCASYAEVAAKRPVVWAAPGARDRLLKLAAEEGEAVMGAPGTIPAPAPSILKKTRLVDELFGPGYAASLPAPTKGVPRPWPPVVVLAPPAGAGPPEHFPAEPAPGTCRAGDSRIEVADRGGLDSHSLTIRFFDAAGEVNPSAAVEMKSPIAPSAKGARLQSSRIVVTCRPGEAHVAWAWSALIDQKANHALVVLECKPGRCDRRSAQVHVETARLSGCGYCRPEPDEFQLQPVEVVDLVGSTALVWRTGNTVRARVGSLDALDGLPDTILWRPQGEEKAWFDPPVILPQGTTATVGVHRVGAAPEDRVFRLEASGAREVPLTR